MRYKLPFMKLLILLTSVLSAFALTTTPLQLKEISEHFIFTNNQTGTIIQKNISTNVEEVNPVNKPQNPWFYGWEVKVAF